MEKTRLAKGENGVWIAVTGLDGSGKTTLVDNLEKYFIENGKTVYRSRLPHDEYIVQELLNKSSDSYTDRMLFAVDNRLFGTELKKIRNNYDIILTQRCFLDSFVHGAVQGYSYEWIANLNRLSDMPHEDVMIHLVAEASVAYRRICYDPEGDKFEYPAYMDQQEIETRKAFVKLCAGNDPALAFFKDAINLEFDTTSMTTDELFEKVVRNLSLYLK